MENLDLLEPVKAFPSLLEAVKNKADEIYDSLAEKAGTDIEANRATVKKHKELLIEAEVHKKSLGSTKGLKGFFIFLIVASFIAAIVFLILGISSMPDSLAILWIFLAAILLGGGIALWVYIGKVQNKKIKETQDKIDKINKQAAEVRAEAEAQMAGLNSLLDWGMPQKAIRGAVPLIELDDNFNVKKYKYLVEKYGLNEPENEDVSTYEVQTGSILGNPFVWERDFNMEMRPKTYWGEITIYWTTTHMGKDGPEVRSHSEVLTASVTRDAPEYFYSTYLLYANEAAPRLCFSRGPTVSKSSSEKDIEKQIQKAEKKAEKLAKQSMMDDDPHDLQLMGNRDFDMLFNALNRNNETEFRLLFTPLAQRNIVSLLKSKEPYGDDFSFVKEKMINQIKSAHSQGFDFRANPANFEGFDFDNCKNMFKTYTEKFFQSIYFDLVPLLSIPLYQQTEPAERIYGQEFEYESETSFYEHEAVANSFDKILLDPEDCDTDLILKTKFLKKEGSFDQVEITSHGFQAIKHIAHISKLGRDGNFHDVPVVYYEYEPVSRVETMSIGNVDATREKWRGLIQNDALRNLMDRFSVNGIYERKLVAFLNKDTPNENDLSELRDIIGK